jgi:hypothetical protein
LRGKTACSVHFERFGRFGGAGNLTSVHRFGQEMFFLADFHWKRPLVERFEEKNNQRKIVIDRFGRFLYSLNQAKHKTKVLRRDF